MNEWTFLGFAVAAVVWGLIERARRFAAEDRLARVRRDRDVILAMLTLKQREAFMAAQLSVSDVRPPSRR